MTPEELLILQRDTAMQELGGLREELSRRMVESLEAINRLVEERDEARELARHLYYHTDVEDLPDWFWEEE